MSGDGSAYADAMRRAIALSREALGRSNPNPAVGAVILDRAGQVVGSGSTQAVGGPHAEAVALAEAGERARGGTAVTTLEPCRHTGRTGPCTRALVDAGVTHVVFALGDPHGPAAGGAGELSAAGITVTDGVLADEAGAVVGPWRTAVARRRSHVTWKYAATLDGRSAAADGSSRWITGPQARADVHLMRAQADAVLVGSGTVLADDPLLTVRGLDWPRRPARVVVDTAARTPVTARVLDGEARTIVAVGDEADPERVKALRATPAEIVALPLSGPHVDLRALQAALYEREIFLVLLEGGPTLAGAFLAAGLVDRVVGYVAPALLGAGPAALADAGVATIAGARRLRLDSVERVGDDVRLVATVPGEGES